MELADMQDLGSCAAMRWGSNPHARTTGLFHRAHNMVVIGVLLAVAEGTSVAWLSSLSSFAGFFMAIVEFIKEEKVRKKVLVMVGNGVYGVA